MEGQISEKLWIGNHSFQIQSRNGVFSAESERGDHGLFGSVDSEILTITVVDPCELAIVNSDGSMVLEDLIAPNGVEIFESKVYNRPVNSVELAHVKFANCGKYFFTLLTSDSELFIEDWLEVTTTEESQFSF